MKKTCPGCKKLREVKNRVSSVMHEHLAAEKAQKNIKAVITFYDVRTNQRVKVCKRCQDYVVDGIANGKNFG